MATGSVLGILLAARGGSGSGGSEPTSSPPISLPSGELGIVTPDGASAAVLGLCEVRTTLGSSVTEANAIFDDRVHEELHIIAAATQTQDVDAAATLLEAKERVEADFAHDAAAPAMRADVDALLGATRAALSAIGLDTPACPA